MMNVEIINQTISVMCQEIKAQRSPSLDWRVLTEDQLLYEAAVCIFGSQVVFEMAVSTADRLREAGLLQIGFPVIDRSELESRISETLAAPFALSGKNGSVRRARPRFRNRLAYLLTSTLYEIYGNSNSFRGLLFSARSAKEAREVLIQHVWGFGPKQASLFLRRVGYCADLAVLDVHLVDYLQLARGISLTPSKLGHLSFYEKIEDLFREIAREFGHSLGCVDLATWLTMRVVKREAYL